MYNDHEENLFGVDMRHRPPLTILPTEEHGWGNSHGRLAYSNMNRAQEWNYSEYALNTMGMMPKNYIIVNENEVNVNRETAFRVGPNRVAIPVKEFARQKRLTLKEQWELMNPQWVGTFFGLCGEDPYRSRRQTLEQAMDKAMSEGCFDEFMQQFWSAKYGHKKAIERLSHRADELERIQKECDREIVKLDRTISGIENDINKGRLDFYHLQGYNAHENLKELRSKRLDFSIRSNECYRKSRRIREYINSITY